VFPTIRTSTCDRVLGPGDVVVLYTDGVTDVAPPHDLTPEQLRDMVAGVVAAHSGAGAAAIADGLRQAIEDVLPLSRRHDDIALLVLRVADGRPQPG
jgi:sigma-B regulation protein RsbU (phosphoserine phosphatase)